MVLVVIKIQKMSIPKLTIVRDGESVTKNQFFALWDQIQSSLKNILNSQMPTFSDCISSLMHGFWTTIQVYVPIIGLYIAIALIFAKYIFVYSRLNVIIVCATILVTAVTEDMQSKNSKWQRN